MSKRVLVISPHCDDAELGCGGYIARTVAEGGEVYTAVATVSTKVYLHREQAVTAEDRVAQFEHACDILGVEDYEIIVPGKQSELHLYPMGEMVQKLDARMADWKPDEVLIPLPAAHQDHVYMYQAAIAACRQSQSKNHIKIVAAYEYPSSGLGPGGDESPSRGGMYVNIEDYLIKKIAAVQAYKTALHKDGGLITIPAVVTLAKLRGLESGFDSAELFRILRWRVS